MSSAKKRGRRRKVVDSWKLKKWYNIYAPVSFKSEFIGQIPSGDPTNLIGRTIWTRLHEFTRDFKHTHIKIQFKIINVNEVGLSCETRFQGSELTRDYVRALIHRGSTRIDGIFNYKTADGFVYRVDAFCVTRRRAKGSQKQTIRKIIYQVLNEFAKSSKHGKFVRGMIHGVYADNIRKIVKTIYPLKECQIRKVKLINYPEGVVEEEYDEEETFEEQTVKLKTHGKQIKAFKKARKAAQKAAMKETPPEEAEDDSSEKDDKPEEAQNVDEEKDSSKTE
jgi:small subunit ribosomal protein S3Ae